jgi:hypothetical protein
MYILIDAYGMIEDKKGKKSETDIVIPRRKKTTARISIYWEEGHPTAVSY